MMTLNIDLKSQFEADFDQGVASNEANFPNKGWILVMDEQKWEETAARSRIKQESALGIGMKREN